MVCTQGPVLPTAPGNHKETTRASPNDAEQVSALYHCRLSLSIGTARPYPAPTEKPHGNLQPARTDRRPGAQCPQVTGVQADRELPVVWAVAKGSLRNKAILVPAALAISAVAPVAITPMLMPGGLFLCCEGTEKLLHALLRRTDDAEQHHAELLKAVADEQVDLVAFEQDKMKGAVRTDFVLSAEIIVITLGTVAEVTFARQVSVLVGISVIMTVGAYGLVAGNVKLDDAGLYLRGRAAAWQQALGRFILLAAPRLMKTLSVVGTAAMFLVVGAVTLWSWLRDGEGRCQQAMTDGRRVGQYFNLRSADCRSLTCLLHK